MNPECVQCEYVSRCESCNDKLTGHEDENGTLCRWCVTHTEVTEGEAIEAIHASVDHETPEQPPDSPVE